MIDNVDKHWRYAIATLLILVTASFGYAVMLKAVPASNKDIVYAIIAGYMPILALAVRDAVSAQRTQSDSETIKGLTEQVASSMPVPLAVPSVTPDVTVQNAEVTVNEK